MRTIFASFLLFLTFFAYAKESLTYEEILQSYKQSYLYEKIGDYKDAIRVLMPIYKVYPYGYTINLRLGWLYYLWGKYENSIFHYRRAISVIPSSVEAKLGLSLPLMAQERWGEVETLMYQVIATDYYNYYGNLRLCAALEKQGKYSMVMFVARKMLTIYPTDVPFLIYLGKSYYHLGNLEAALRTFKDALVLDPENNTAKEFLKKIKEKLNPPPGKKEKSRQP
jgi:tetratricopeptide (TPR) repeat protein